MKRGKILIVDDNEDILFTLKMLLRPLVESITMTTDPRELLPLISRTHFNVILLDMNFRRDAVSGKEGFHWTRKMLSSSSPPMQIRKRQCKPLSKVPRISFPNPGKTKS